MMKKQLTSFFSFAGKTLSLLTLFFMALAVASCGSDDDDSGSGSGGSKKTPEQLIRGRWEGKINDGWARRIYLDLTGKKAKVAYQYALDYADGLGIDGHTWYEGVGGDIKVVTVTVDGKEFVEVLVDDQPLITVPSSQITETNAGPSLTAVTENITIEKLPFHDLLVSILGQWKGAPENSEYSASHGNLLEITDRPFFQATSEDAKNSPKYQEGHYYYATGGTLLVIGSKFSAVSLKSKGGSTTLNIVVIDNNHIQVTYGSGSPQVFERFSKPVTIE